MFALSRATNTEGLHLRGTLKKDQVVLDILAFPFVIKALFLFHDLRKMVGFHFSSLLSKLSGRIIRVILMYRKV